MQKTPELTRTKTADGGHEASRSVLPGGPSRECYAAKVFKPSPTSKQSQATVATKKLNGEAKINQKAVNFI